MKDECFSFFVEEHKKNFLNIYVLAPWRLLQISLLSQTEKLVLVQVGPHKNPGCKILLWLLYLHYEKQKFVQHCFLQILLSLLNIEQIHVVQPR